MLAQFLEMLVLRFGRSKIMPDEYFDFRLFDPRSGWARKREYLGRWTRGRVYRLQDPADRALADDKLRAYRLFGDLGLPYPRILAVADPTDPFPGADMLHGANALAEWLGSATYPIFAKPALGQRGIGARVLLRCEGGELVLGDGTRHALNDIALAMLAEAKGPLILQERIRPHSSLAAIVGDRTATARIVVLNDREEPEVFRAALRIPVGNRMTDNFHEGKDGNLLALIDREIGRALYVLAGVGIDRRYADVHPDTGASFKGLVLPDWDKACAMVVAGSRALPGLKILGWDVAFSDQGPLLVEVNARPDYSQQANDRGLAEPRFLDLYPGGRL